MSALKVGQRVTLLKIDDMMAMSHRYELEIRSVLEATAVGYHRKQRVATVRQKGKRKEFYLDLGHDDILLDCWDVPFRMDTEGGSVFSGNACYNIVGDPEAIRACIETRAVFPVSNDAKGKILVYPGPRDKCGDDDAILLYPDIDVAHAVINRFKEAHAS